MKCEKCNKESEGYDLFPYCGKCGANFCDDCWARFRVTGGGHVQESPEEP